MNLCKKWLYRLSRMAARPMVPPELLILSLTQCCNLKCLTCNIGEEITKEHLRIDLKKIFDIISQAREMKIDTIVISGGEPFLVAEIFDIIKYIKGLNMSISVTTNGYYSDEMAQKIAGSGIDHLHFSLDGLGDHHDAIRGKGTFDRLMKTVSLIKRLNTRQGIGFGTVICSQNCGDLFEMTKIADDLKANIMNFIPLLIDNTDPQNSKKGRMHSELWPDGKDLVNIKDNFAQISGYNYRYLKIDAHPSLTQLLDYYSLRCIKKKCFAGYKSMIITAPRKENGGFVSEVFFCQDSCGNVYTTSLKSAWGSRKARVMRQIAKRCANPCLQFCHYI